MTHPLSDDIPTSRLVWDRAQTAWVPATKAPATGPAAYLSGIIPLDWLAQAHGLGGQCLPVGLLLWRLRNATKRDTLWLGRPERARFKLSDKAYREALRRLEGAGLVAVERPPGRAARVTIRLNGAAPGNASA